MTPRIRAVLAASLAASVSLGVSSSVRDQAPGPWPPVKPGLWELKSQRTLPNGKTQSWTRTSKQCHDPSGLFRGYWGLGILEKAGCRYQAAQLSGKTFSVASRCVVRGVGISTSEAIVTVHGDDEFDMQVHVDEGSRQYRARQAGCWIAECSESGSR
jgi:Protein of unknown function (DUF3617)